MVIGIEYYKGDTLLYGPMVSFAEFKSQMSTIEKLYDREEDNFIALLCRIYHWTVLKEEAEPEYVYDRDIEKCIIHHFPTQPNGLKRVKIVTHKKD